MGKTKKSFSALQSEIEKLLQQQEALKTEKLEIILDEFRKAFKSKKLYERLCDTDDAVLKKYAQTCISSFENIINKHIAETEQKAEKVIQSPVPQHTNPVQPQNTYNR